MPAREPLLTRHVQGAALAALWGGVGFLPAFCVAVIGNPGSAPFEAADIPQTLVFSLFAAAVVAVGFGIGVLLLGLPLQAGLRAIRLDGLIPSMIVGAGIAATPGVLVMAPSDTPPMLDALAIGGLALGGALAARIYRKAVLADV